MDKHDIVKVEMPHKVRLAAPQTTATKAVQLRVGQNKSVYHLQQSKQLHC
ncbi:hypothetical protein ACFP1L_02865 [Lactiplantibacillus nangangensis]|uniref:Uncharacterized protein n=1 Tax=Lactiplantibacillus nangangensis TaxID=2559917 RepID=A0ABW1SGN3_9LACO|nr:hypothetical protein [Lactiplantibacillus nangangensis]